MKFAELNESIVFEYYEIMDTYLSEIQEDKNILRSVIKLKRKLKEPVWPYDRPDFCQLSYKELQELKKQYYKDAKEYYNEYFGKKQAPPDEDNQLSVPASLCLGTLLIIGCFFSIIGLLGILFLIIMDLPDIDPEGWLLILEFIGFFLLYLGIKK